MTQPTYFTESTQTTIPQEEPGLALPRRTSSDVDVEHRRIDRPSRLGSATDGQVDSDFGRANHDEVALAALERLAESSVAELRFLRVDHQDNEIRLNGRVRSFYHKQLAQETVRPIANGNRVVNEVKVD
ncbi:MAG: BON domain-containing protein [Planctomycetota bacterium]